MKLRKHLHMPGLLKRVRSQFEKIKDPLLNNSKFPLVECLMSGLALFGLKYSSLLQFEKACNEEGIVKHNLKTLYGISRVPSDTYFRERLDEVDPRYLQTSMNRVIAQLQRGKLLEAYRFFDDHYLVSIEGTGYFSSHEIHCESCCVRHHRNGSVTYYHHMLAAVLVHPLERSVLPLALEAIQKEDGKTKNDCEHEAVKRLLQTLKRSHPHLKLMVTLDALYADSSIIRLLQSLNIRFIITAKKDDLKYLFECYEASKKSLFEQNLNSIHHSYCYVNKLPLNDSHQECEVNMLEYKEVGMKKKQYFCWVTDMPLKESTVMSVMRGGRARWKIENETFNTLKNQGYQFEHNFGHGYHHLSVVLAYLMFLAFLIDQIQEFCCPYFRSALKKMKRKLYLWNKMRGMFLHYLIDSWEQLYEAISDGMKKTMHLAELLNTS